MSIVWTAYLNRSRVWFLMDIKAIIANTVKINQKTKQNKNLHFLTLNPENNKEKKLFPLQK